jgi:RNA recognition motif-containing protein
MSGVSVSLRPLFDDRKNIVSFIERSGFVGYTGFQLYDDFCFVTFPEYSVAQRFVSQVDGVRVNGYTVSASIVPDRSRDSPTPREPRRDDPSPRPRPRGPRSKTVAIKNYPVDYLGDRNLWHDFRDLGFIRQIEVRRSTGYIQFDSESDALNAVDHMDGRRLNGSRITVELIPDRILNLPNVVVPLIVADPPRERAPREPGD